MMRCDVEDMALFLLGDKEEPAEWLEEWVLGYPTAQLVWLSRRDNISGWQTEVKNIYDDMSGSSCIAVVAHGIGAVGFLAWLYSADIHAQHKICNIILVSPPQSFLIDNEASIFCRTRCCCPAALVIGNSDSVCPKEWAEAQAAVWNMRLLIAPQQGWWGGRMRGWEWGMRLMQEMLHS